MMRGHLRGRLRLFALLTAAIAFFAIAGNAGAAPKNGKVLILADTVSAGVIGSQSVEENAATSLGYGADVVNSATWSAMTTAQFAAYDAIVLGDPTCSGLFSASAAIANRSVWGPAVDGNKIFVGTDPVYHYRFTRGDIYQVTYNAVKFAADSAAAGKTGAYIGLSCYYHGTAPNTPVPLLDPFGTFTMTGVGCFNDAHIVATHPALAGLTDAILSNWSCSVHEAFDSWPSGFLPLAIARGEFSGALDFPDGSRGTPYIVASGEGLHLISNIDLTPTSATNEVGNPHTVTALVKENGNPVAGTLVTFKVLSGPNAGVTGTDTTNAAGVATFTYTSLVAGIDTIEASYVDSAGKLQKSNDVTKEWTAPLKADVSVVKSGPALVQDGGSITYTIIVSNAGPGIAKNVSLADSIPAGITGAAASPSQGSCSGSFTCALGDIAAGGNASVTITGTVSTSGGSLSNTASASADSPDPDGSNNSSTTTATVNHAPSCTGASAGPSLWPPNHKLVWSSISGVTDADGNPVSVSITGIRQDEPTNGLGDGDTAVDGVIGSGNTFAVRAERSGTRNGRVYHVLFSASDGTGGACTGDATIGVPHDQGPSGGPIDDGALYDSLL